jgi:hypothetical protein
MDTNANDDLSILDIFDPLRPSKYPSILPPESDVIIADIPTSLSFPYLIKFRLKLSTCSEMKPFCQLVEQIQNEHQLKDVNNS